MRDFLSGKAGTKVRQTQNAGKEGGR